MKPWADNEQQTHSSVQGGKIGHDDQFYSDICRISVDRLVMNIHIFQGLKTGLDLTFF